MSMQDVNIEFEVPTPPEMDVSLEIVTNGTSWGNIEGDITKQTDLQNALNDKQDVLTAGANITIDNNVISATDTTYTAGEGISIVDNVISNTQTSAEWGNIQGDIADQTDLIDLIDTKIDIEATARENNDLSLQNGINTLNDDLTAEISNRGTADGVLQDNIDTLSDTVTSNYNTLDGKIGDNKTAIDNHIADKNNPHEVSKAQVGLGNVDNTSDLNKPISTATQNALNTKVSNTREINGYSLSSDITLTASDVDALPDTTKYAASMNLSIDSSTYVITAQLKDQNGDNIGTAQTIDLPLESVVVSGSYDSTNKKVVLTLQNGSTIEFSVADLVSGLQTEITSNNKLDADLVDDSTSTNKFATASQLAQIGTNQTDIGTINNTIGGYGDIVTHDADEFATAAQGALADTAVQPADLSTVATTGDYDDLTNKPTLFSGDYNDLTNKPSLSTVATTGDYDDLTNKPTIPAAQVQANWNETDTSSKAYIQNKPSLSTVATSGSYNDLTNKPTIPTVGDGTITITQGGTTKGTFTTNQSGNTTIDLDAGGGSSTDVQINGTSITSGGVADIITEGVYDSTTNKIATMSDVPAAQVQSNWDETDTNSKAYIQNKPTIPSPVTVDGALSTTSENPVQNKVITSTLNGKLDKSGGTMTGNLTVGSSSIGTNGWIQGTWLRATAVTSLESATDIAVLSNGWIYKQSKDTLLNGCQTTTNLVTSLSASSTDTQYPSAKCVYDIVGDIETALNTINSGV